MGDSGQTPGSRRIAEGPSAVGELRSVPQFPCHPAPPSSLKWGCLFSFCLDAPALPSQVPSWVGLGTFWFPCCVEIPPSGESETTGAISSGLSSHSPSVSFFSPDLVPPNHSNVTAQPADDHICIVLRGKGRSSQTKRPKALPTTWNHSGHSSAAHLLQLVPPSPNIKQGEEEKEKKRKEEKNTTLVMFTDFDWKILRAF